MTYKSILVHCADEKRWPGLLATSIAAARRFEAHLTALSVLPPLIVDPALTPGGVTSVIDRHRKVYEQEQGRMREVFEEAIKAAGLNGEWCTDDAGHGTVLDKLIRHGRSQDLIIASRSDKGWPFASMLEAPVDLVLNSGRPVLLVPTEGDHRDFGRRALVAWNGRREAARAAFDAVPFLQHAGKVSVLWIETPEEKGAGDVPGADLCTTLARHGITCEAASVVHPGENASETLLARQRQTNADLVVMGCYGHSRLSELVLGGMTRSVLGSLQVPILMSH